MQIAVVLTATTLLLLAAKVAFIGCYNVFQALGEHGYLPAAIARASRRGSRHGARCSSSRRARCCW